MVYHRGIGVERASGRYISEKLDLLVQYLLLQPAAALWAKLR
jgi:hypothetical protein